MNNKAIDTHSKQLLSIPIDIGLTDSYTIKGGAGYAVAHVKKPSGEVITAHYRADGALKQMTHFDPSTLTVNERRKLEYDLYKDGHTQSEIADLLGIKQPTVAHDLKLMRNEQNSN